MLIFYFDKPHTVFKVNGCLPLPPCLSPFHSLSEMMGGSRIHGRMTVKVYSCQDTRGGSTFPLAQVTPLSPTSIEDEAEAGSESEGEPTLIKTSTIKSEIITECAVFSFNCIYAATG